MDFSSQTLSMIQAGVVLVIITVVFIISFCHPAEMQTLDLNISELAEICPLIMAEHFVGRS